MLQIRQTDRKETWVRARAPLALVTALKTVATKRDLTLSVVVRQALIAGTTAMLEAEDKTEAVTP